MFKYRNLLNRMKGIRSAFAALEEVWAFVTPVAVSFVYEHLTSSKDWKDLVFVGCVIWASLYFCYLCYRVATIYRISNDKLDAYRSDFAEQLDGVHVNKYHMLCKEIHFASRQGKDLLIYDAHGVVNDILVHIKQLVSKITGVPLSDISVNFIYKYSGNDEHWQTIDGSSGALNTKLDDMVEYGETMYHYLYVNNRNYVFFNDKAKADWHMYSPSIRDGDNKEEWGSIYCRRVLCTMYHERFVDGILSISTYSEKFTQSKKKTAIRETESLIDEAVSVFMNLIRSEMTALYIRHEYNMKREIQAIKRLMAVGHITEMDGNGNRRVPEQMAEEERRSLLREVLPIFKSEWNASNPGVLEYDSDYDSYVEAILKVAAINANNNKKAGQI